MPKGGMGHTIQMYSINTQARKIQLKKELHNVQRENMNINDYPMKANKLADSLASLSTQIEDIDVVSVTLNGLGKEYCQFQISIGVHKTFPNLQELIVLLMNGKQTNETRPSSGKSNELALDSDASRGRGRGRGGRSSGRFDKMSKMSRIMEVDV